MSNYEWDQSLSVGDNSIDDDHKGLFELINQLESADNTRGFMANIIAQLEAYAGGHFSREEEYMRKANFPGYEEHVKQHQAFVEWIESVKITYRRAAESPFLVSDIVNDFVKKWLVSHIMKEDMKYRDFILSQKK